MESAARIRRAKANVMTLTSSPFSTSTTHRFATFARRLRSGEVTADGTARELLVRIAAADRKLQALHIVDSERALARAEALDRLLSAGVDLGPLMGLPIAVKDLFSVEGMPTTPAATSTSPTSSHRRAPSSIVCSAQAA